MGDAVRLRDRIDTTPRFDAANVIRLNQMFRSATTDELLRAVLIDQLVGDIALVSSFGTESAVLLDLVAAMAPSTPILFLDTGKHFPETLAYRDTLAEKLNLNIVTLTPDPALVATRDDSGLRWSYDPDGCCDLRKVLPLEAALARFDASITGRKAFQASTRAALPRFDLDGVSGRIKVNPLIDWTRDDITAHFAAHDLPRHPLEGAGYPSVGCAPCTSMVQPGEDPRAGRWRGWDKTECGIHTPASDRPDGGTTALPDGFDPIF